MASDDYIKQRISEEQRKVRVDSYQDTSYEGSFRGAGRGLWSGSFLGMATGAIVGAAAPFFPLIVGAGSLAAATAALPASIAVFAAMGISMGFAGGAMTGRGSGGVAAVAREQETRIKKWVVEQVLKKDPDTLIEHEKPKETKPAKPFSQKVKDTFNTYINWRTGAFFTLAGIVGGLVIGAAFVASGGAAAFAMAPALGAITGLGAAAFESATAISAAAPAIMAYSAGVAGMFGLLGFGTNYPKIATQLQTLAGGLLSGKLLGKEFGPSKQPERAVESSFSVAPKESLVASQQSSLSETGRNFQELVAKSRAVAADAGELIAKR
jgi:hypothetical protein